MLQEGFFPFFFSSSFHRISSGSFLLCKCGRKITECYLQMAKNIKEAIRTLSFHAHWSKNTFTVAESKPCVSGCTVSLDFRTLILETAKLSTLVINLVLLVYTLRCITCPYMLRLYKLLPLMFYLPSEQKSRMLIE